jgi:DNA polymerase-3 subunit alpha
LPEGYKNDDEYLRFLTYKGAEKRWGELTKEHTDRLDFELAMIEKMGFPGYFLIVQDFLNAAREMGVSVGPGRGSAAGSAVAYALKITDIDPIKYGLLFERFLNLDRISLPDIDIDFDEDGREAVLKYVANKYGNDKVAHIITFGTMAAKMAIRDVARVQKLPLSDADRLAKLVPERPGVTLDEAYNEVPELAKERESSNKLIAQTLKYAQVLEGSVRQSGVHACGIIIGKESLDNYIPICTAKDAELYATQYDGSHVESVGLLKMDFLGLKTLSIIKDAIENIRKSKGVDIDIENLDLNDKKTYELFSAGDTTGIFQFESPGVKKYLKELKPNRLEDLIAMNALYRPGPMEYIPKFIKRKHGVEKIEYPLPVMEQYLDDTYGITVYQEQVMLLSQALAGFTKGEADSLRKAMGKKKRSIMDEMKMKFKEGCAKNGYAENIVNQIWSEWDSFAQYAFNKSHSTCYALVAFQTGYLKANYPAEYMSAVLSRNLNDIRKITTFMDETRRMGIEVLGPDVNESDMKFTVNKDGNIRFGLGAIKGVGEAATQQLIGEREKNGLYKSIYDLVERVNLTALNKKSLEAMAVAGAFDDFSQISRAQYFSSDVKGVSFIECPTHRPPLRRMVLICVKGCAEPRAIV